MNLETLNTEYKLSIVCEECGESVNKLSYKNHLKTHKPKKDCQICQKKFTNLSNFKYHMSHHSNERLWHCTECPKSFKTKVDLTQHKRTHNRYKEPQFVCEICLEKFIAKSQYIKHLKKHVLTGPQNCELCNKTFKNLRTHVELVHQKIKKFKCSACDKQFGKKSGLDRHFSTVHEKLKLWNCDICMKSFGEKGHLLRHRRLHFQEYSDDEKLVIMESFEEVVIDDQETLAFEEEEDYFITIPVEESNQQEDCIEKSDEHNIKKNEQSEQPCIQILNSLQEKLNQEPYCYFCCVSFKDKRYLQAHNRTFHKQDHQLPCKYCDEKFIHRTQRMRHVRKFHPEAYEDTKMDERRTCKSCNITFQKLEYLELHCVSQHGKSMTFMCDFCAKNFSFKTSLERHIRTVHFDRRDFLCLESSCAKAFRSKYELKQHLNSIHGKNTINDKLKCEFCDKICQSRKALYAHKKTVHEGVRWNENLECKICFQKFDTKYMKVKHFSQVHHNGEIKKRTCHLCLLDFKYFDDFMKHIQSHQGAHICTICGYNFSDSSQLLIHQESHKKIKEELRQYICDVCSHRVSTKLQLEIHLRKHTEETPYVCDECGKAYKYLAPFRHHKLVHENKFDFKCSHCDKSFLKPRDLKVHEKIHSEVRPYRCHICNKSFALKSYYCNHMKTHDPKNFECKICHVYQSSLPKLRIHETSVHPEEFPNKCASCSKLFKTEHMLERHYEKCRDVEALDEYVTFLE